MESIIFLSFLFPLTVAIRSTPGRAFLLAYLPSVLLLPEAYHTRIPGIPKVSFNQVVGMTVLAFVLNRYGRQWKISFMDLLVFALVAVMGTSEYMAAGYSEAQNLSFGLIAGCIAPYLIARIVIPAENLHVATARQFVILIFTITLISVYEFKMGLDLFFELLRPFFPGQGTGWVVTFRYGFARIAGPFGHCILAGVIFGIAFRLQRWLQWGSHWESSFKNFPNFPLSKARLLTWMMTFGSIMTMARGPWLGGMIGGIVMVIGRSKKRNAMLTIVLLVTGLVLPPAYIGFNSYMDAKPGIKMSESQQTAVYRKELMEKYSDIAIEHLKLGWGRTLWPKVMGMSSIDNYFLLLTLMHGAIATGMFLSLFLWSGSRLLHMGMHEPIGTNSLSFTFAGILLMVLISLVTVYLGENVTPVLFLIFGWAEAHLQQPFLDNGATPVNVRTGPSFRVIR